MRGLTNREAELLGAAPGDHFDDSYCNEMNRLVAARRARITGHRPTPEGLEPRFVETRLGRLALQLWRAGIK